MKDPTKVWGFDVSRYKKRIVVNVGENLWEKLQLYAKAENLVLSAAIRKLLEEAMEKK